VLLAAELILSVGKLLYAALHDGEIKRHRFKLRLQVCRWGGGEHPAERWNPSPYHLAPVGLPSQRAPHTDEKDNGKASKPARYWLDSGWPVARELCLFETCGAISSEWSLK